MRKASDGVFEAKCHFNVGNCSFREAERQLRVVQAKRRERIEQLGYSLRKLNMAAMPGIIMVIAVGLGIWRGARKRRYISHGSDA